MLRRGSLFQCRASKVIELQRDPKFNKTVLLSQSRGTKAGSVETLFETELLSLLDASVLRVMHEWTPCSPDIGVDERISLTGIERLSQQWFVEYAISNLKYLCSI